VPGDASSGRPEKRSVTLAGHQTSLSLEPEFWNALGEIADQRGQSVAALIADIDRQRGGGGLSGAVRVFILNHYRGS